MTRRSARHQAQAFHEAWESGAPASGEVAALVHAAEVLCSSAAAQPEAGFRDSLRERLMTEAADVLVAQPGAATATASAPRPAASRVPLSAPARHRRRLVGVAAALVTALGSVGLVAGSASAMPGDMLYPVKRGVESVESAFHRSAESRGGYDLERAATRLQEAQAVLARDSGVDADRLADLLDDFTEHAEQGAARLFDTYGSAGSNRAIDTVNDFAAASALDLSAMSPDVPDGARASFEAAVSAVAGLMRQTSTVCSACSDVDVDSLVGAVSSLVEPDETEDGVVEDQPPATTAPKPSASPKSTPGPTTKAPTATPSPTPKKGLPVLTDPLLGGLLGDDEQEGLVPGLLNGLLGNR